ncbi:peptide/nickel transport system permease protein [Agrobacterium tumefaciens]|uniref:ABC transporter permease n=1 Tax=Agrobacterium tumefaciens TaxID=358 RepID=A0AAP9E8A6_AGRTU|nr:ABC transporter permease [Agrobacterium tumefaciens]MBP2511241.1 peptide/nickel transport system permease protein [Agrobacterium tumefaciens]MBP2520610.1 peptide/nickel transport system permease protein [Agrobacterium tumefaciens]MBP2579279.1 peptide/nickel transport system permease protein [Agrobacterium tumefaciens]MBP2597565.1 peptide/nickel transport system permease protein [Agrobacterium tumefaciens]MCW8060268.1 ABC transporter permease [Agrobacterium tumefaciens]
MSISFDAPLSATGRLRQIASRLLARPSLTLASLFLLLVATATLWPQFVTAANPLLADPLQAQLPPSAEHWFGTDHLGRDVFSRVIYGARYSILIGVSAIAIAALAGSFLGLVAGLARGVIDELISRFLDVVSSFPDLLLALVLISFTGPGTVNLIFALGVASVPRFARVVRAQTFVIARSGYVEQAKTFGLGRLTLVTRHILPHAIAQVPILATIGLGSTIIQAAGLSFLGMGPQPPTPEWGAMLAEARNYLRVAWWIGVWPGVAITLTVIAISILGKRWQLAFEGRRQA